MRYCNFSGNFTFDLTDLMNLKMQFRWIHPQCTYPVASIEASTSNNLTKYKTIFNVFTGGTYSTANGPSRLQKYPYILTTLVTCYMLFLYIFLLETALIALLLQANILFYLLLLLKFQWCTNRHGFGRTVCVSNLIKRNVARYRLRDEDLIIFSKLDIKGASIIAIAGNIDYES